MSSIEEINAAMLNPNNTRSRAILREAQDKGYITKGNKWIVGGLKTLFDLNNRNAQSQQNHAAEQERKKRENTALKYMQSLVGG